MYLAPTLNLGGGLEIKQHFSKGDWDENVFGTLCLLGFSSILAPTLNLERGPIAT